MVLVFDVKSLEGFVEYVQGNEAKESVENKKKAVSSKKNDKKIFKIVFFTFLW